MGVLGRHVGVFALMSAAALLQQDYLMDTSRYNAVRQEEAAALSSSRVLNEAHEGESHHNSTTLTSVPHYGHLHLHSKTPNVTLHVPITTTSKQEHANNHTRRHHDPPKQHDKTVETSVIGSPVVQATDSSALETTHSSSSSATTTSTTGNDGCALNARQHNLTAKWMPAAQNESLLQWLRDVKTCANRFALVDIKFFGDFNEAMQVLQCNQAVTPDIIASTLLRHDTLWFIGDSLLMQQFYALLCMLNTNITTGDMEYYREVYRSKPDDLYQAKYVHHHTNDKSNRTTTFMLSRFGFTFHPDENNLYKIAFPQAIQTLTSRDAIVLTASSHYNHDRAPLMERAMKYVKNMAPKSNATLYYMEASPEEWPTSNGIFADDLYKKSKCQALNADQLDGHYQFPPNSNIITPGHEKFKNNTMPPPEFWSQYLPWHQVNTSFSYWQQSSPRVCYPDCLPATWRSRLAQTILLGDHHPASNIHMVPTFWQMVDKQSPNNAFEGDCTHKSQEAIVMMNQQLIRTMVAATSSRAMQQQQLPSSNATTFLERRR